MSDLTPDDLELKYTLRLSQKAKYLQIRISNRGLEVIVPQKKPPKNEHIREFIKQKRFWIEKHLKKIETVMPVTKKTELPIHINLNAINQVWDVFYIASPIKNIKFMCNQVNQIKLIGYIDDKKRCLHLLRQWIKLLAKKHLSKELEFLSHKTGLQYNRVTIRNNLTRWGSCSRNKSINLCCKLLFLPPHLMRHVLLHELCHTKYMNHGRSFWALLEKYDALTQNHTRELRVVRKYLPAWIDEL